MKKVLKNKIFWTTFMLLSVFTIVAYYGYNIYLDVKGVKEENSGVNVIEDQFGTFILYYDSTDYQRTLFKQLKETNFTAESTPEEIAAYLDVYAQNYVADYVTVNVKDPVLNRTGGKQFLIEPLQASYDELDGVADYYASKKYYIEEHKDTYKEELPEVSLLTLQSSVETTFDYFDETGINPDKVGLPAYTLQYSVEYTNKDNPAYTYYDTVTVTVANWDGIWTVVEMQTNLYNNQSTVISFR